MMIATQRNQEWNQTPHDERLHHFKEVNLKTMQKKLQQHNQKTKKKVRHEIK
jgi:hypothetical protein